MDMAMESLVNWLMERSSPEETVQVLETVSTEAAPIARWR
jgi:hypothetical protein